MNLKTLQEIYNNDMEIFLRKKCLAGVLHMAQKNLFLQFQVFSLQQATKFLFYLDIILILITNIRKFISYINKVINLIFKNIHLCNIQKLFALISISISNYTQCWLNQGNCTDCSNEYIPVCGFISDKKQIQTQTNSCLACAYQFQNIDYKVCSQLICDSIKCNKEFQNECNACSNTTKKLILKTFSQIVSIDDKHTIF